MSDEVTDDKRYAIFKSGGKQYRVSVGDKLKLEKLEVEAGENLTITEVLAIHDGETLSIGKPMVDDAQIELEIVKQLRSRKIKVFKKKRRQNYRRTNNHRQHLTQVMVKDIRLGSAKPAKKKAAPKAKKADDQTPASGE
ncbi:MAG: 50S ribosomal protein L21 [Alphaproteobacteria bacterium]